MQSTDFAELYAVAADPNPWEQHPTPDCWQRAEFQALFDGALQSGAAFKIVD
ncbi:hypothetical protein [Hymenobacter sp. B81]|uniref:hypothetical protein n=1 Tax=Hymenobacter sp. B81 TaxID=3344878 RepID=UPI0037DCA82F